MSDFSTMRTQWIPFEWWTERGRRWKGESGRSINRQRMRPFEFSLWVQVALIGYRFAEKVKNRINSNSLLSRLHLNPCSTTFFGVCVWGPLKRFVQSLSLANLVSIVEGVDQRGVPLRNRTRTSVSSVCSGLSHRVVRHRVVRRNSHSVLSSLSGKKPQGALWLHYRALLSQESCVCVRMLRSRAAVWRTKLVYDIHTGF